eukprot:g1361.t1
MMDPNPCSPVTTGSVQRGKGLFRYAAAATASTAENENSKKQTWGVCESKHANKKLLSPADIGAACSHKLQASCADVDEEESCLSIVQDLRQQIQTIKGEGERESNSTSNPAVTAFTLECCVFTKMPYTLHEPSLEETLEGHLVGTEDRQKKPSSQRTMRSLGDIPRCHLSGEPVFFPVYLRDSPAHHVFEFSEIVKHFLENFFSPKVHLVGGGGSVQELADRSAAPGYYGDEAPGSLRETLRQSGPLPPDAPVVTESFFAPEGRTAAEEESESERMLADQRMAPSRLLASREMYPYPLRPGVSFGDTETRNKLRAYTIAEKRLFARLLKRQRRLRRAKLANAVLESDYWVGVLRPQIDSTRAFWAELRKEHGTQARAIKDALVQLEVDRDEKLAEMKRFAAAHAAKAREVIAVEEQLQVKMMAAGKEQAALLKELDEPLRIKKEREIAVKLVKHLAGCGPREEVFAYLFCVLLDEVEGLLSSNVVGDEEVVRSGSRLKTLLQQATSGTTARERFLDMLHRNYAARREIVLRFLDERREVLPDSISLTDPTLPSFDEEILDFYRDDATLQTEAWSGGISQQQLYFGRQALARLDAAHVRAKLMAFVDLSAVVPGAEAVPAVDGKTKSAQEQPGDGDVEKAGKTEAASDAGEDIVSSSPLLQALKRKVLTPHLVVRSGGGHSLLEGRYYPAALHEDFSLTKGESVRNEKHYNFDGVAVPYPNPFGMLALEDLPPINWVKETLRDDEHVALEEFRGFIADPTGPQDNIHKTKNRLQSEAFKYVWQREPFEEADNFELESFAWAAVNENMVFDEKKDVSAVFDVATGNLKNRPSNKGMYTRVDSRKTIADSATRMQIVREDEPVRVFKAVANAVAKTSRLWRPLLLRTARGRVDSNKPPYVPNQRFGKEPNAPRYLLNRDLVTSWLFARNAEEAAEDRAFVVSRGDYEEDRRFPWDIKNDWLSTQLCDDQQNRNYGLRRYYIGARSTTEKVWAHEDHSSFLNANAFLRKRTTVNVHVPTLEDFLMCKKIERILLRAGSAGEDEDPEKLARRLQAAVHENKGQQHLTAQIPALIEAERKGAEVRSQKRKRAEELRQSLDLQGMFGGVGEKELEKAVKLRVAAEKVAAKRTPKKHATGKFVRKLIRKYRKEVRFVPQHEKVLDAALGLDMLATPTKEASQSLPSSTSIASASAAKRSSVGTRQVQLSLSYVTGESIFDVLAGRSSSLTTGEDADDIVHPTSRHKARVKNRTRSLHRGSRGGRVVFSQLIQYYLKRGEDLEEFLRRHMMKINLDAEVKVLKEAIHPIGGSSSRTSATSAPDGEFEFRRAAHAYANAVASDENYEPSVADGALFLKLAAYLGSSKEPHQDDVERFSQFAKTPASDTILMRNAARYSLQQVKLWRRFFEQKKSGSRKRVEQKKSGSTDEDLECVQRLLRDNYTAMKIVETEEEQVVSASEESKAEDVETKEDEVASASEESKAQDVEAEEEHQVVSAPEESMAEDERRSCSVADNTRMARLLEDVLWTARQQAQAAGSDEEYAQWTKSELRAFVKRHRAAKIKKRFFFRLSSGELLAWKEFLRSVVIDHEVGAQDQEELSQAVPERTPRDLPTGEYEQKNRNLAYVREAGIVYDENPEKEIFGRDLEPGEGVKLGPRWPVAAERGKFARIEDKRGRTGGERDFVRVSLYGDDGRILTTPKVVPHVQQKQEEGEGPPDEAASSNWVYVGGTGVVYRQRWENNTGLASKEPPLSRLGLGDPYARIVLLSHFLSSTTSLSSARSTSTVMHRPSTLQVVTAVTAAQDPLLALLIANTKAGSVHSLCGGLQVPVQYLRIRFAADARRGFENFDHVYQYSGTVEDADALEELQPRHKRTPPGLKKDDPKQIPTFLWRTKLMKTVASTSTTGKDGKSDDSVPQPQPTAAHYYVLKGRRSASSERAEDGGALPPSYSWQIERMDIQIAWTAALEAEQARLRKMLYRNQGVDPLYRRSQEEGKFVYQPKFQSTVVPSAELTDYEVGPVVKKTLLASGTSQGGSCVYDVRAAWLVADEASFREETKATMLREKSLKRALRGRGVMSGAGSSVSSAPSLSGEGGDGSAAASSSRKKDDEQLAREAVQDVEDGGRHRQMAAILESPGSSYFARSNSVQVSVVITPALFMDEEDYNPAYEEMKRKPLLAPKSAPPASATQDLHEMDHSEDRFGADFVAYVEVLLEAGNENAAGLRNRFKFPPKSRTANGCARVFGVIHIGEDGAGVLGDSSMSMIDVHYDGNRCYTSLQAFKAAGSVTTTRQRLPLKRLTPLEIGKGRRAITAASGARSAVLAPGAVCKSGQKIVSKRKIFAVTRSNAKPEPPPPSSHPHGYVVGPSLFGSFEDWFSSGENAAPHKISGAVFAHNWRKLVAEYTSSSRDSHFEDSPPVEFFPPDGSLNQDVTFREFLGGLLVYFFRRGVVDLQTIGKTVDVSTVVSLWAFLGDERSVDNDFMVEGWLLQQESGRLQPRIHFPDPTDRFFSDFLEPLILASGKEQLERFKAEADATSASLAVTEETKRGLTQELSSFFQKTTPLVKTIIALHRKLAKEVLPQRLFLTSFARAELELLESKTWMGEWMGDAWNARRTVLENFHMHMEAGLDDAVERTSAAMSFADAFESLVYEKMFLHKYVVGAAESGAEAAMKAMLDAYRNGEAHKTRPADTINTSIQEAPAQELASTSSTSPPPPVAINTEAVARLQASIAAMSGTGGGQRQRQARGLQQNAVQQPRSNSASADDPALAFASALVLPERGEGESEQRVPGETATLEIARIAAELQSQNLRAAEGYDWSDYRGVLDLLPTTTLSAPTGAVDLLSPKYTKSAELLLPPYALHPTALLDEIFYATTVRAVHAFLHGMAKVRAFEASFSFSSSGAPVVQGGADRAGGSGGAQTETAEADGTSKEVVATRISFEDYCAEIARASSSLTSADLVAGVCERLTATSSAEASRPQDIKITRKVPDASETTSEFRFLVERLPHLRRQNSSNAECKKGNQRDGFLRRNRLAVSADEHYYQQAPLPQYLGETALSALEQQSIGRHLASSGAAEIEIPQLVQRFFQAAARRHGAAKSSSTCNGSSGRGGHESTSSSEEDEATDAELVAHFSDSLQLGYGRNDADAAAADSSATGTAPPAPQTVTELALLSGPLFSGYDAAFRANARVRETQAWLLDNLVPFPDLLARTTGAFAARRKRGTQLQADCLWDVVEAEAQVIQFLFAVVRRSAEENQQDQKQEQRERFAVAIRTASAFEQAFVREFVLTTRVKQAFVVARDRGASYAGLQVLRLSGFKNAPFTANRVSLPQVALQNASGDTRKQSLHFRVPDWNSNLERAQMVAFPGVSLVTGDQNVSPVTLKSHIGRNGYGERDRNCSGAALQFGDRVTGSKDEVLLNVEGPTAASSLQHSDKKKVAPGKWNGFLEVVPGGVLAPSASAFAAFVEGGLDQEAGEVATMGSAFTSISREEEEQKGAQVRCTAEEMVADDWNIPTPPPQARIKPFEKLLPFYRLDGANEVARKEWESSAAFHYFAHKGMQDEYEKDMIGAREQEKAEAKTEKESKKKKECPKIHPILHSDLRLQETLLFSVTREPPERAAGARGLVDLAYAARMNVKQLLPAHMWEPNTQSQESRALSPGGFALAFTVPQKAFVDSIPLPLGA